MPLMRSKATGKTNNNDARGGRALGFRWFRLVVFGSVLSLILFAGVMAYQLSQSTLHLSLVRDRIEAALQARLPPGHTISVETASLAYRRERGLVIEAENVEIVMPGEGLIFASHISTAAEVAALFGGSLELRKITVSGLRIVPPAAPVPSRSFSRAEIIRRNARRFASAVAAADDALRGAGFEEVLLFRTKIEPRGALENLAVPEALLSFSQARWSPLSDNRSKLSVRGSAAGQVWTASIERARLEDGTDTVRLALSDLSPDVFWPALNQPGRLPRYVAPGYAFASVRIDPQGDLAQLRARLTMGAGFLSLAPNRITLIDEADITFQFDLEDDVVRLPRVAVFAGQARLIFSAKITLPDPSEPIRLVGRIADAVLPVAPWSKKKRYRLTEGMFKASIDVRAGKISLDQLTVKGPAGSASLAGTAELTGPSAGIALALSLDEAPIEFSRGLWPAFVTPKVLNWIDANLSGGFVGPGTLRIALPLDHLGERGRGRVLPPYALEGSIAFRDVRFTPIESLPMIGGAAGIIDLADATAKIKLNVGKADLGEIGTLDASGTVFTIPELGKSDISGNLELRLAGPAAALALASNAGPLNIARERGIQAVDLTGNADLQLTAKIPLNRPFSSDEVLPWFRLALNGFSSNSPINGRTVEVANIVLEGTPDAYTVKGKATLDGIPAELDIDASKGAASTGVTLTLDDAARREIGFDLGDMLTGPVTVALSAPPEAKSQRLTVDLEKARISLPFLGWEKGPGVPATAKFVITQADGITRISDFSLAGKGFRAVGTVTIGESGLIRELDLKHVALRPGDDFSIHVTRVGKGYRVSATGAAFDARGLITAAKRGDASETSDTITDAMTVKIAIDQIRGYNDTILIGVAGDITMSEGKLRNVALAGGTVQRRSVKWTIKEEGAISRLALETADGGEILRFLDVYNKIRGGRLSLNLAGKTGSNDDSGVLTIKKFKIRNEKALTDAVGPVTTRNTERARENMLLAMDTENIGFTTLKIPFRRKDDVLTIGEAFLRGPVIGATGRGTVDLDRRTIAIRGTFVPAFGINNLASAIPLFGRILGGGRNEGLVGITYKIVGPLEQPTMTLNPLSAIAPGIFRKIFEYR
ncbi:MAG: hypothetical protein E2O93_08505 [Alphaproteobacteria bacterium]|nr:MAG: hypothetical protein E2O93_08505 [Alphaproteobacteria bacterium]